MELIKSIPEMQKLAAQWSTSVGFVPTMGYLHHGHISLVQEAAKHHDTVVVSIFVNPTQFSPNEDLDTYPRNLERDLDLLRENNVTYVYFPSKKDMYPHDFKTWVNTEFITQILCGRSRPNHFRGVTTVLTKLLNIVRPDAMYMGEKDFQQLAVTRQMAQDLNFTTEIVGCPIVREPDGLAMSSRNSYLSAAGRENALCLYEAMQHAKASVENGITDFKTIRSEMRKIILAHNGVIDYIELVDSNSLHHLDVVRPGSRLLLAVKIEDTRLIDNIAL